MAYPHYKVPLHQQSHLWELNSWPGKVIKTYSAASQIFNQFRLHARAYSCPEISVRTNKAESLHWAIWSSALISTWIWGIQLESTIYTTLCMTINTHMHNYKCICTNLINHIWFIFKRHNPECYSGCFGKSDCIHISLVLLTYLYIVNFYKCQWYKFFFIIRKKKNWSTENYFLNKTRHLNDIVCVKYIC